MKKFILSMLTVFALSISIKAGTYTVVLPPGTMTNLLTGFQGSAYVEQFLVTATTATNAQAYVYDVATNSIVWTQLAYTNIVSYPTNYYTTYTNYYGVVQYSYTNVALLKYTNSVPGFTNNYPPKLVLASLASTTTAFGTLGQLGYYFDNGVWATNTGTGNVSITITYR